MANDHLPCKPRPPATQQQIYILFYGETSLMLWLPDAADAESYVLLQTTPQMPTVVEPYPLRHNAKISPTAP